MTIEYHEPANELSKGTRDIHRGLCTLVEELEAIDWYQHRLELSTDEELCSLMLHNRNEEMVHAAMALEWLRRKLPDLDAQLKKYLYTDEPIVRIETNGADPKAPRQHDGLGIGSLRKGRS